jgi:hypothetical protein
MAEKKGNLIKLVYEFNSARCCEVSFDNEKWARVTAREFRSWNGKRRILNVDNPNKPYYEEYMGPVYYYGTNFINKKSEEYGLVFIENKDPRDAKRPRNQAGF